MVLRTFNTEKLRVKAAGNVGIGTAAPGARLHVIQTATNGFEGVARFSITGVSSDQRLTINNTSGNSSFYEPGVSGRTDQAAYSALTLQGFITPAANSGTEPMMSFETALVPNETFVRPLFTWKKATITVMRMDVNGNLGIGTGTATPSGKLHVNGTVVINPSAATLPPGSILTDQEIGINPISGQLVNLSTSSIHFKQNVENLQFDREAFHNLRPVNFSWKEYYGGQSDVGLIAQEVSEIFPALASWSHKYTHMGNGDLLRDSLDIPVVDTTQIEVSGVRYHKLSVYLLAEAQLQYQELIELRQQVQELTERIDGCCAAVQPMNRIDESATEAIGNMDEFILLKNDPNPFADYTDVRYEHTDCVTCEIIVSDNSGRILKRIKTTGSAGIVRIYSSEIGSGLFVYSLVKDGQTVRSEKMISSTH